jgi:hypothetical protein
MGKLVIANGKSCVLQYSTKVLGAEAFLTGWVNGVEAH